MAGGGGGRPPKFFEAAINLPHPYIDRVLDDGPVILCENICLLMHLRQVERAGAGAMF